jgi:hypothetical protein
MIRCGLAHLLLVLGLSGCAPRPAFPPAICTLPRQFLIEARALRPDVWYRLLVDRGLDGAPCDCTGKPIEWQAPPQSCREAEPSSMPLPTAPFSAVDLVLSTAADDMKLVWVITQRFDDGDAVGPVALVRGPRDEPEVLVTGTLRAGPQRARLSLITLGQQSFLSAEGESCASRDPSSCQRSTRLLAERDGRFVPTSFVDENGACIGPAELFQKRSLVVPISSSFKRRFELTSTLAFESDRIVVQETVTVSNFDPSKGEQARVERRADVQRIVRIASGRLVVYDPSLWSRIVDRARDRRGSPN